MARTVVGVFDTPAAARTAEERLVGSGIDPSSLHIAAQGGAPEPEAAREGGMPSGIRDFFAELFGTEHSEEIRHYSDALRRGGVLLVVNVAEGAPLEPIRQSLLDAGAVDVDERIEGNFRQSG